MKMVDFTSGTYSFLQAVAEGDFHIALGVAEDARKLDIDVAAARLADRMPSIADDIAAIASVLVCPGRRVVCRAACDLRDRVYENLVAMLGENLDNAIPNCRRVVWEHSCQFLGFGLDHLDSMPSSAEAASMAVAESSDGAAKIVESILNACLTELNCRGAELLAGSAVRDIWYAYCPVCNNRRPVVCMRNDSDKRSNPDSSATTPEPESKFDPEQYEYRLSSCPQCRAHGVDPVQFDDIYDFDVELGSPSGTVVRGETLDKGGELYAILGENLVESVSDVRVRQFLSERDLAGASPSNGGNVFVAASLVWVAIFVLTALIRGGAHLASSASKSPKDSRDSFEHSWTMPDYDPLESMRDRTRVGRESFTPKPGYPDSKPRERSFAKQLDAESDGALAEAKRLLEDGYRLQRADRHLDALSRLDGALDILTILIETYPRNQNVRSQLASVHYSRGEAHAGAGQIAESIIATKAAIDIYDDLARSAPDNAAYVHSLGGGHCNLANQLSDNGEYDQAIQHYTISSGVLMKHLRSSPRCTTAARFMRNVFWGRGRTYYAMKRWKDAIRYFSAAITADSRVAEIYRNRGFAYVETSQWKEAADDLARAAALSPNSWETRHELAIVALRKGDQEAYVTTCREMVNKFGKNADPAIVNAALWTTVMGPNAVSDYGPLIEVAKRAVAADSDHAIYRKSLGALLYRAGHFENAVEQLLNAEELREESDVLVDWLFLSMACHHNNDPEQAQHWLNQATAWIDKNIGDESNGNSAGFTWSQKLEIEMLSKEANVVFNGLSNK